MRTQLHSLETQFWKRIVGYLGRSLFYEEDFLEYLWLHENPPQMRLVQVIFGEEGEVSRRINWAMQPILFQLQNSPVGIKANLHSVLAAAANKKQFAAENAISLLPPHNHQCWHQLSTLHCNNKELLKTRFSKNWAGSLNSIDHTSWRNARSVLYFRMA